MSFLVYVSTDIAEFFFKKVPVDLKDSLISRVVKKRESFHFFTQLPASTLLIEACSLFDIEHSLISCTL